MVEVLYLRWVKAALGGQPSTSSTGFSFHTSAHSPVSVGFCTSLRSFGWRVKPRPINQLLLAYPVEP